MIDDIKTILMRSPSALMQDAAGIAAIGVIMIVALNLPNLV